MRLGILLFVDVLEKAAAAAGIGVGRKQARFIIERECALGRFRNLPTAL
jgi:hypothetical protein